MRRKDPQMTPEGAIHALRRLDITDPEVAHSRADTILLLSVSPRVREAYLALADRSEWWSTA